MVNPRNNKIRIHPPGTRITDSQKVTWLRSVTPTALGIAKKILVTAAKYRKGGGWFSSKRSRGTQLQNEIYKLEEALRKDNFRKMHIQIEGPLNVMMIYLSHISDAYPNWQPEYSLLNNFIPSCLRSSEQANKYKRQSSVNTNNAGVLRNKFGDYIYPGEEGYNKLFTEQQKKSNKPKPAKTSAWWNSEDITHLDIGKGYNKQIIYFKKFQNGTYEVVGRRIISSDNPEEQRIKDLSGDEIGTLAEAIEKSLSYRGNYFSVTAKLSDPADVLSPIKLWIIPNNKK